LFDVSFMQSNLTDAEKREHFILLHSWESSRENIKAEE
jgi:hypothetical protein